MIWYLSVCKISWRGSWVVAECPDSIVDYYRWWVHRLSGKKISAPLHGAHISLVVGKRNSNSKFAHSIPENCSQIFNNEMVEFEYSGQIEFDVREKEIYYWLPIKENDTFKAIREHVSYPTHYRYHLTIGNYKK